MKTKLIRIAVALFTTVALLTISVQPVAAVHNTIECEAAEEFEPLLQLLHDVAELLYTFGIALGVVSLAYAGIAFMWGSKDAWRRAKRRVQRALVGVVVLLSSPLVISFLVSRLPGCGGG